MDKTYASATRQIIQPDIPVRQLKRQNNVEPLQKTQWPAMVAIRRRREIIIYQPRPREKTAPPTRKQIIEFSQRSGSRLKRAIDSSYCDYQIMVTLTYPKKYPTDGREVKKHWRAFIERFRRSGFWEYAHCIWWLEFQARGAPHLHMVCTHTMPYKTVARVWSEVTGGNIRSCSRVEKLRCPSSAGAYAAKYAAKKDQKALPDGFKHVGRWWGRTGAKACPNTMPGWYRERFEARGDVVPPMTTPKLAAATSSHRLVEARVCARAARTHVRAYACEHATMFFGSEEALNDIWRALTEDLGCVIVS